MAKQPKKGKKGKSEPKTAAKDEGELTEDQLSAVAGGVTGSTESSYLKVQQGSVVTEKIGADRLGYIKLSPDAVAVSPDIAPTHKLK